jgi:uncharacterized protein (DUF2147 family)
MLHLNFKKIVLACGVFAAVFLQNAFADTSVTATPIGQWQQIDEKTNQLHSIIDVYAENGKLYGKILKTFAINGKAPRVYCDLCKGDLYNAKIIGLTIMQGFESAGNNVWNKGTILDPSSGKVYSCKLTLTNNGQNLRVRGFVGVSILGRTQVWTRVLKSVSPNS